MKLSKSSAVSAWVAFNLLMLVAMPALTFVVLRGELDAERRLHPQMSTDGDSLGIPMFGVAILTFVFLLCLNLIIGFVAWLIKRGARSLNEPKAPIAEP